MSGQAAAPGRTPSGSEDHSDRIHPSLILSVLSLAGLAYSVLSSAVIPALPDLQHSLPTVTGFNDTYVMATTQNRSVRRSMPPKARAVMTAVPCS